MRTTSIDGHLRVMLVQPDQPHERMKAIAQLMILRNGQAGAELVEATQPDLAEELEQEATNQGDVSARPRQAEPQHLRVAGRCLALRLSG